MFLLKKVITSFILPPGIIIVMLTGFGIWSIAKNNKGAGAFGILLGCAIWFFTVAPVSDAMFKYLERDIVIPESPHGDVIVLLSGGIRGDGPIRLFTAARLSKIHNIPIIVSGKPNPNSNSLLPKLQDFLFNLGVPPSRVILEPNSRDTTEHAKYTKELVLRHGFKNIILVTSAYHMKRAITAFNFFDMEVLPYPAGFRYNQRDRYSINCYLPGKTSTAPIALKEYIGLLFYTYIYYPFYS